jgi:hypothetical protein
MLEQNTARTLPTLVLGEKVGPTLNLEPGPTGILRGASSTWVATAVFGLIGLAASAFMIPLGQGQLQSPWSEGLRLGLPGLWGSDEASEAIAQKPNQADESTSDEASGASAEKANQADKSTPEVPASEVSELMGKLKGKYCFNYMPTGDDQDAREAFSKLYWNKLNVELSQLAEDRLDVCTQFAYQTPEVLVGGGCQKSNCGTNDVTFYINRQGKIAMDYRVEGECSYAAEDGFTQINLLCSN